MIALYDLDKMDFFFSKQNFTQTVSSVKKLKGEDLSILRFLNSVM